MNRAIGFLIFNLQLSVCRGVVCSAPYRDIHNICLHFPSSFVSSWCDAQAYCASRGGELVQGANAISLAGKIISGPTFCFWLGLTDLLNDRGNSKIGWRWSDGSDQPPSSSLSWFAAEPSGGAQDCTMQCTVDGEVRDLGCSPPATFHRVPMCQPRSSSISSTRSKSFKEVAIPVGLSLADSAKGYCSKLETEVKSKIRCAMFCNSDSTDSCVAFYFNKAKKQCRLVLYTDATVDLGNAEGWKKLVMKK